MQTMGTAARMNTKEMNQSMKKALIFCSNISKEAPSKKFTFMTALPSFIFSAPIIESI